MPPSATSEDRPLCPYCAHLSDAEAAASRGVVIAALEAGDRGDEEMYRLAVDGATALDFHSAVDMITEMLNATRYAFNVDPHATVANWRKHINEIQAGER